MLIYDMHVHTKVSHDSKMPIDELCVAAVEGGVSAFAVTDHPNGANGYENIRKSASSVDYANEKYGKLVRVMKGVELDDLFTDKKRDECALMLDYDIILGSCHCVIHPKIGKRLAYSVFDYSQLTLGDTDGIFMEYINEVEKISELGNVDVLSHLTCPLRYINGKNGFGLDITKYHGVCDRIFHNIIRRDIALELNISGLFSEWNTTMPDLFLLKRYYELGGRLVTVGSDSHVSSHIGEKFDRAAELLLSAGFREYYYYEKRIPKAVKITV